MSDLIAIAYEDVGTAREVMQTLDRLGKELVIELEDAVIVERRENGNIKLHQSKADGRARSRERRALGSLIGLIFMVPLLGAAIGGGAGARAGR